MRTRIFAIGSLLLTIAGLASVTLYVEATQSEKSELQALIEVKDAQIEDSIEQVNSANVRATEVIAGLADREASAREEDGALDVRQEALGVREAELNARESALSARETNLAVSEEALRQNSESWIVQVRECLARDGDYVSASVTLTRYSGLDFSCYTG